MCIISFHLKQHPAYKLILIANRDEFYGRPTAKAHYWEDAPFLLAGRDLQAMGTWMGITKTGRLAALTNYRDPKATIDHPKSRGKIVSNYLTSTIAPKNYLHSLKEEAHRYNGFNLLVGSVDDLYFYNKAENTIQSLKPGTYSVSNASLNTPWPKVIKAKHTLQNYCLNNNNIDPKYCLNSWLTVL